MIARPSLIAVLGIVLLLGASLLLAAGLRLNAVIVVIGLVVILLFAPRPAWVVGVGVGCLILMPFVLPTPDARASLGLATAGYGLIGVGTVLFGVEQVARTAYRPVVYWQDVRTLLQYGYAILIFLPALSYLTSRLLTTPVMPATLLRESLAMLAIGAVAMGVVEAWRYSRWQRLNPLAYGVAVTVIIGLLVFVTQQINSWTALPQVGFGLLLGLSLVSVAALHRPGLRGARLVAIGVMVLVLVGGGVMVGLAQQQNAPILYDLTAQLPAQPAPQTVATLRQQESDTILTLTAPPDTPAALTYRLTVPANSAVQFWVTNYAIPAQAHTYQVVIQAEGQQPYQATFVNPSLPLPLHPCRVDLSPWAGQSINLTLRVSGGEGWLWNPTVVALR